MNPTARIIKSVNFNNKVMWLVVLLFTAAITGIAIADGNWLYLGIVLSPLIILLCIYKPFIFPFGLYVFLIPFDGILSATDGRGSTLTKLLGALTILVLCIKGSFEKKLIKPDKAAIWFLLFMLYSFLSIFWAIEQEKVISGLRTFVSLLILYLVVVSYSFKRNEYDIIKLFIIAGGFSSGLFLIYSYVQGNIGTMRSEISLGGQSTGANKSAFELLIPLSICLFMMLHQNKKIIKNLFLVIFTVMFFGIILTGSRGGFLGAGIIIILFILSIKKKITFGVSILAVVFIIAPFIPELFIDRVSQSIESKGSGRLDIWYVGLQSLKKYWLWGAGSHNFENAYTEFIRYAPKFIGFGRASHNIYLSCLVEVGIVGILLFICGFWKHYQAIKIQFNRPDIEQIMLKAAFWAVLVSSFFLNTDYYKSYWLLWMLILIQKNVLMSEK